MIHIYPYNPLTNQPASQPPFFLNLFSSPNHPTFLVMISFNQLWQLFAARGALASQHNETEQLWNSYSPEQQQHIYDTISQKLRDGRFIHFNPCQAIRENARKSQTSLAAPTNYFGRPLPRGVTFYRADYQGVRGLYTEQDVRAHHMSNPELFIQP